MTEDKDRPTAERPSGPTPDASLVDDEGETVSDRDVAPDTEENRTRSFPVVGIGASAGGLEAFTRLLQHLPVDTGMAFVFVQHLAPQHSSMLASLLSRTTTMPVMEVQHGTPVQPNHVYVIPPNTLMSIADTVLELEPRPDERGAPRPIDHFFHSLAADRKGSGVGVILSGADSDGALGLQAIRGEGGITIVQSETSARHADMPRAAIAAGTVDMILSPEEIGGELARITRHLSTIGRNTADDSRKCPGDESQLNRIFALLRRATGVDFRGYKRGTVWRRITRRMIPRRLEDIETYITYLESNPSELPALHDDILINVTGFFRDPEVFQAFENEILPRLVHKRASAVPLRVWVPGCSTGEEVYSIAMCLAESIGGLPAPFPIQIFGTDLSERAIAIARSAIYSEVQLAGVSPERRARFFASVENGWQIVKSVREMGVFARQNVCVDPPFSRLDLISCRNTLIYLEPVLQRQVAATFHYALRPNGYLMLGRSEGLRGFPDLFSVIDKQHKFYARRPSRGQVSTELITRGFAGEQPATIPSLPSAPKERSFETELEKEAERIVWSEHAPAWVIVNERLEIIHSRGDTSPYLKLAQGRATLELLKMVRESIRGELRALLTRAKDEDGPVQAAVWREKEGGEIGGVGLEVRRIAGSTKQEGCFLVLFLDRRVVGAPASAARSGRKRAHGETMSGTAEVERLRQELVLTSQRLQSMIDERDAANQDLTSANEEIQSSNEELQSINEELETSKEELQSSVEELNTINAEMENRNQELNNLSDDLANILRSASMPMLVIDNDLRIKRLTTSAERFLNFRSSDLGRPIADIRTPLSMEALEPMVRRVLETLNPEEMELQDRDGRWHMLHVRPYRTSDNRMDGAVLVLVDIDQERRALIAAEAARQFAESVIESVQTPLLVLWSDLRVRLANRAFFRSYGLQPADVENRFLYMVSGDRWNLPGLRTALGRLSADQESVDALEFEQEYPGSGKRTLLITARRIQPDEEHQILLAIEDVTAQRQAESVLRTEQERLRRTVQKGAAELERTSESLRTEASERERAETALHQSEGDLLHTREELRALTASLLTSQEEERRRVSRELHDDLSQKLAKLQFDVETLEKQLPSDLTDGKRRLQSIRDEVAVLSNDLRRIAYELHPSMLDHLGLPVALRAFSREFSEREGIPVRFKARKVPEQISPEVASALYRITQEALRNVAKHAGKTTVKITLTGGPNEVSLSIRDDGIGFDSHSVHDKRGLGLISMQERTRLLHGEFSLETSPGHGVILTIRVPHIV